MSDLNNYTISGVRCDASGCGEEIHGPELSSLDDEYQCQAVEAGWTIWNGRSRRHYCPQHGPKPGHRMSQWAPRRAGEASR